MKILMFSHENDIDGMGPVVLGKIAFGDVDVVLAPNIYVLEERFREYLSNGKLQEYDMIYITDLALHEPSLSMVANDSSLSKKVLIFDHHKASIDALCDKYPFAKIVPVDANGTKRCGTDLFYEYLLENGKIKRASVLDDFVELTRLEDTWEWKMNGNKGITAHDMAILFNSLGTCEYIRHMYSKVTSDLPSISFTEEEQILIKNKKEEYVKKLDDILSDAEYFNDEFGNYYGIVIAPYEYRNELAEYIRSSGNINNIKYFILVALEKGNYGQKSYRSIVDGFDVNEIAMSHGGGGHRAASSVNITKEQYEKIKKMTKKKKLKYLADSSYNEKA